MFYITTDQNFEQVAIAVIIIQNNQGDPDERTKYTHTRTAADSA